MGIMEILGLAGSISLLSGWRLYLTILATGLAMHWNMLPVPAHLASLAILANPWVMGTAGVAALCEFLADELGLPRRAVTVLRGDLSRQKILRITGLTLAEVKTKLGV